jgi:Zn-dependent M28 family amino/carboxypeptidase
MLASHGAAAITIITASDARWERIRDQYQGGRTLLAADVGPAATGAMSDALWQRLAEGAGRDARQLERAATGTGFRALPLGGSIDLRIKTAIRRYQSVNVVGRIIGAERPGEALLYTAHWDHLGICRRPTIQDRICNGAVDNASGIALMLEAARGLANGPKPARSIFFVATTAEEYGLLGARALARNLPIPAKAIVAALNLDTVAIAPRGAPVAIIGRGTTPLDPLIDATARALGRKVDGDTEANALIARQDGWELTSAGIPAVMIGGAFSDMALLESFFASRYHGPSDDIYHGIELGGAAEDTALHIALGRVLADPARFPTPSR